MSAYLVSQVTIHAAPVMADQYSFIDTFDQIHCLLDPLANCVEILSPADLLLA